MDALISMDQLRQLLAAKPASGKKVKSWLDEPRKVQQRQVTPSTLSRMLGKKIDVKKRHMRTQHTGQEFSGLDIYGAEREDSNDIVEAAYSPRNLMTRRSHLQQITLALKRAGAIPMSMKIKDAALKCYNENGRNIVTEALRKTKI